MSFEILEIVTSQILNADGYAEPRAPGEKAVFFLDGEDLKQDRLMTPFEFLSVYQDETAGGKKQEVIQPLMDLPLFFADTGKPYGNAPEFMPLKDFLFSLKKSP